MADPAVPRHVVLIGIPGAGKSAVGRALGRRMGRRVVDLDDAIVARAGRSIPEIFASDGESGFRALELAVTREVAAEVAPLVVTPGGGWATRPEAVALLAPRAVVVWLDAAPDEAFTRMGRGWRRRPLLAAAGSEEAARQALRELHARRSPLYASAADHRVLTRGRTANHLSGIIKSLVGHIEKNSA